MPPRATNVPADQRADPARAWLPLGRASQLVGVDPDTLRRWADAGRLRAFTTPGGHRRFDRRDLDRLTASRRSPTSRRSLADLGATSDRLNRAYARSYRTAADGRSRVGEQFDDPQRAAFRADGRRLLTALLAYLDAPTTHRGQWEAEAVAAVRATGARLAAHGAEAHEAAGTFIAARRPFLTELATLGRRRSLDVAALTTLYDEAVELLDRLLLELLDAFARPDPEGVSQ